MVELLVPADAEVEVVAELNASMPDDFALMRAGTKIPDPRPDEFIRVVATGGAERDLVTDDPILVVEAFSTSETRAQRGCAFAIAVLQAGARMGRVGAATCHSVRVLGLPANLPMPTVPDHFRFTATISASLRRAAG